MLFKSLVSLTCVVVLAAVGYHFWGEWRTADAVHRSRVVECQMTAQELVAAQKGQSLGRRFVQADAKQTVERCLADDLIGLSDVDGVTF